jgi:hypothetical protein
MTKKTCSVCGAKDSLVMETKEFTVRYGATELTKTVPVLKCSCCGARFDLDNKNDEIRKEAMLEVRQNSVTENLEKIEKKISLVDLERSFALPSKTLSKWKNKSKVPSAAAAALVNLIGVFPWLSYVAVSDYNPITAYKIAGAAFFKKTLEFPQISISCSSTEFYDSIHLTNPKTFVVNTKTIESVNGLFLAGDPYDN